MAKRRRMTLQAAEEHLARIAAQDAMLPEPIRAVMSVPARTPAQLASGRRHRHDWQMWGDDEMYERCEVCGACRKLAVKQWSLF